MAEPIHSPIHGSGPGSGWTASGPMPGRCWPGPGQADSVLAVVKCDAYGHGAAQVSRTLLEEGVDMLAVSGLDEAAALSAPRPSTRPSWSWTRPPVELAQEAVTLNLAVAAADLDMVRALDQ